MSPARGRPDITAPGLELALCRHCDLWAATDRRYLPLRIAAQLREACHGQLTRLVLAFWVEHLSFFWHAGCCKRSNRWESTALPHCQVSPACCLPCLPTISRYCSAHAQDKMGANRAGRHGVAPGVVGALALTACLAAAAWAAAIVAGSAQQSPGSNSVRMLLEDSTAGAETPLLQQAVASTSASGVVPAGGGSNTSTSSAASSAQPPPLPPVQPSSTGPIAPERLPSIGGALTPPPSNDWIWHFPPPAPTQREVAVAASSDDSTSRDAATSQASGERQGH